MYVSSGIAELFGVLLAIFTPFLAAAIGSAIQGALATAAASLLGLSAIHALGIVLALGGHRLHHNGHWLGRPVLWGMAISLLMVGSLSTNIALFYTALLSDNASTSKWLLLAPISGLLAQVSSTGIVVLWLVDRAVRVVSDFLRAMGSTPTASARWKKAITGGRWVSLLLWGVVGLGLTIGSLIGLLLVPPLLMITDADQTQGIWWHGAIMLVGMVAGVRMTMGRLKLMRHAGTTRQWRARLRLDTSGGALRRLFVSLCSWATGEALLWTGSSAMVLSIMMAVAASLEVEPDPTIIVMSFVPLGLSLGMVRLARLGGWLRATEPGTRCPPQG